MADESKTGDDDAKAAFGGTDFDWENYERFRPSYPQVLFDAIFAFHGASNVNSTGVTPPSADWETAYDFGCGPGTTFAPLLRRFRRVVGVDMNRPQLDAVLKRFEGEAREGRVRVIEGKAEDVVERVAEQAKVRDGPDGDGGVDLVIAAEAVHWFDRERWLEGAGKMLKPGGTLAVIQYAFDELDDEEASAIWQSYLHAMLFNRPHPGAPPPSTQTTSTSDTTVEEDSTGGEMLMASLLDTLEVPSSLFTNETRIHWPTPFQSSSPFLSTASSPAYRSMRSPDCSFTAHPASSPLLRQKRTKEMLLQSLETLGHLLKMEEEYDGGREMRAAIEKVGEVYRRKYEGREEFEVRWPCALVLATKK